MMEEIIALTGLTGYMARDRRIELGLTREEIGEELNLTGSRIGQIENTDAQIPEKHMPAFVAILYDRPFREQQKAAGIPRKSWKEVAQEREAAEPRWMGMKSTTGALKGREKYRTLYRLLFGQPIELEIDMFGIFDHIHMDQLTIRVPAFTERGRDSDYYRECEGEAIMTERSQQLEKDQRW